MFWLKFVGISVYNFCKLKIVLKIPYHIYIVINILTYKFSMYFKNYAIFDIIPHLTMGIKLVIFIAIFNQNIVKSVLIFLLYDNIHITHCPQLFLRIKVSEHKTLTHNVLNFIFIKQFHKGMSYHFLLYRILYNICKFVKTVLHNLCVTMYAGVS